MSTRGALGGAAVLAVLAAALGACGSDSAPAAPDAPAPDAGGPVRSASGQRLVEGPAVIGGLTADGYVAYYDFTADGHTQAKILSLTAPAGTEPTTIATSNGTGKADIRFEIRGGVVFAWTDRGNRVADLTIWSAAAGTRPIGLGVRPGRAAATADGAYVMYERDVTAETVNVAAGPIGGAHALVAQANALDNTCWQDTDLAAVGDHFVVRACVPGSSTFRLISVLASAPDSRVVAMDAPSAWYGADRVAWLDSAGAFQSAHADGTGLATIATDVAEFAVSADGAAAAMRTATAGAILVGPVDGSAAPQTFVPAGAVLLGAFSPDRQTVLFSTLLDDKGAGYVLPYADVRAATAAGVQTLVPGATSCAACMTSNFTPDGRTALVLDPIDNSQAADAAGPLRAIALDTGATRSTYGTAVYNALAIGGDRFLLFDAVRNAAYATGWIYGLATRGTGAADDAHVLGQGVESLAVDPQHTTLVYSLPADPRDDLAGIWVAPLAP